MKNNIFSQVLNEWELSNELKKLSFMQQMEDYFAKEEGREARKVVYNPNYANLNIQCVKASAFYNREESDKICIIRFLTNPMEAIMQIHHEGYHANVHDYVLGKANLEVYNNLPKTSFIKEQENNDIIFSELIRICDKNAFRLRAYGCIEEKSNGYENSMVGLKIVLDLIENEKDMFKLLPYAATALEGLLNRLRETEQIEKVVNINYEGMLNLIDMQVPSYYKTKIKDNGKIIITQKDKMLSIIFYKLLGLYKKCYEKNLDLENLGVPGEIIEALLKEDQMAFINEYILAVSAWLSRKIFC